jgi:hypothetical protein
MSTYVVRIRNTRIGDFSHEGEVVTPGLILGLIKTSGAELTYMQNPSRKYPLTLICNDLESRSVYRFLEALERFNSIRTEVARLL